MLKRHVKMILVLTVIMLSLSNWFYCGGNSNVDGQPPAKEGMSTMRLMGLSAASALSPGIALLKMSYDMKDERNISPENAWPLKYIWVFWIVGFIDVILDKMPIMMVPQINQFVEHGIIWFIAYMAVTCLNADVSAFVGALTGSSIQGVRQVYSGATDTTTGGFAAPVRSTIEDVIGYKLVSWLV